MREIEFRAKNTKDVWVSGYLEREDLIYDQNYDCSILIQINTLGQYTGLKDKNGTKIFEEDLIKSKYGYVYKVYYEEYRFRIEDKYGNMLNPTQMAIDHYDCEVIGNIYDNPELVKE